MRKLARDGKTWTPTEKHRRDNLMNQFCRQRKGKAVGVSDEFIRNYEGIDWGNG